MKKIKYEICHDIWTFSVLEEKEFRKKHPKHKKSDAITTFDSREVDFKIDEFCLENVRHELLHCHFFYCFTQSMTEITVGDIEEAMCDLVGQRLDLLKFQSETIYRQLK